MTEATCAQWTEGIILDWEKHKERPGRTQEEEGETHSSGAGRIIQSMSEEGFREAKLCSFLTVLTSSQEGVVAILLLL